MDDENELDVIEQQAINSCHDKRSVEPRFWWIALAVMGLIVLAAWCSSANAQVSYTTKGRIVLSCNATRISEHVIETEATERVMKYAAENGGKASCRLEYPDKVVVVDWPLAPPVACPAQPADETQTVQCPSGTTGTWTQTRTYASAPPPTCWTAGSWTPNSPLPGSCPAVPAPLEKPVVTHAVTRNTVVTTNSNVTLSWPAVTGATKYEVERCGGANCMAFAKFAEVTALSYTNSNLPAGVAVSYRVRAVDATRQGAYSDVVSVVTPTYPVTQAGAALVRWWHNGKSPVTQPDGTVVEEPLTNPVSNYRIDYSPVGPAGPSLNQTFSVQAPANYQPGAFIEHEFKNLTPGRWAFAVTACTAIPTCSVQSAIATKDVQ